MSRHIGTCAIQAQNLVYKSNFIRMGLFYGSLFTHVGLFVSLLACLRWEGSLDGTVYNFFSIYIGLFYRSLFVHIGLLYGSLFIH